MAKRLLAAMLIVAVTLCALMLPSSAEGEETYTVSSFAELTDGVHGAILSGKVLSVSPDTVIAIAAPIRIDSSLTINGGSFVRASSYTGSAELAAHLFVVGSYSTLDLTATVVDGGAKWDGGEVSSSTNSTGLSAYGAAVKVEQGSILSMNMASMIWNNCNIAPGNLSSDFYGGGVLNLGGVNLNGGSIVACSSVSAGGGIYSLGAVNAYAGNIMTNYSGSNGGGIAQDGDAAETAISGAKLIGNRSAGDGSGIFTSAGKLSMSAGQITGNITTNGLGAVYSATNPRISGSIDVSGNQKGTGASRTNSNIYIPTARKVIVSGALARHANIGISSFAQAVGSVLVTVDDYSLTDADFEKFFLDDDSSIQIERSGNSIILSRSYIATVSISGATAVGFYSWSETVNYANAATATQTAIVTILRNIKVSSSINVSTSWSLSSGSAAEPYTISCDMDSPLFYVSGSHASLLLGKGIYSNVYAGEIANVVTAPGGQVIINNGAQLMSAAGSAVYTGTGVPLTVSGDSTVVASASTTVPVLSLNGNASIQGGLVSSAGDAIALLSEGGTVDISGGIISNKSGKPVVCIQSSVNTPATVLNISGGEITSSGNGASVANMTEGKVVLVDGIFGKIQTINAVYGAGYVGTEPAQIEMCKIDERGEFVPATCEVGTMVVEGSQNSKQFELVNIVLGQRLVADADINAIVVSNRGAVLLNSAFEGGETYTAYYEYGTPYAYTAYDSGEVFNIAASRYSYILDGWYTDLDFTTEVIDASGALLPSVTGFTDDAGNWVNIEPEVMLYAKWAAPGSASQGEDGFYNLVVTNGYGSGTYQSGTPVSISAEPVATTADGVTLVFFYWATEGSGDVTVFADQYAVTTRLTMPAANLTVTAHYATTEAVNQFWEEQRAKNDEDENENKFVVVPSDKFDVVPSDKFDVGDGGVIGDSGSSGGSGSGGSSSGSNNNNNNSNNEDKKKTYTLTLSVGSGGGKYEKGEKVKISCDPVMQTNGSSMMFIAWQCTQGDATVEDKAATTTYVVMPANDVSLNALYGNRTAYDNYWSTGSVSGTGDAAGEGSDIDVSGPGGFGAGIDYPLSDDYYSGGDSSSSDISSPYMGSEQSYSFLGAFMMMTALSGIYMALARRKKRVRWDKPYRNYM